jgi:hypothetical protein
LDSAIDGFMIRFLIKGLSSGNPGADKIILAEWLVWYMTTFMKLQNSREA